MSYFQRAETRRHPYNRGMQKSVAIIGGGPAGLMAAEVVSVRSQVKVDVYDSMPSLGRKF